MATAQRRFVDDASHQLRTPLTTLATQVGFALRERDPSHTTAALQAIKLQLDATVRQTNQMLALARADSAEFGARPGEVLDVVALAERLTCHHWPQAREAGIDLGFEPPDVPCKVTGHVDLLAEALSNLLHNAIRYTPAGGHVTVRVSRLGDDIELAVEDDGPGMTDDDCARAGERFLRPPDPLARFRPGPGHRALDCRKARRPAHRATRHWGARDGGGDAAAGGARRRRAQG